jgi:type IV pilus assembly protein PilN
MMRINLLPHREEKRKARQKQFGILAGLTATLALALCGFIWFVFDAQITNQQGRNNYLISETAKLDKQIEEIKRIREETAALLAKKQVVEALQSNRSEPVYLLDQMLRQLPEGLYLKSIKQTDKKINVTGYAQSSARVSTFMRNIEASPYLENPNLIEIKVANVNGTRANEFNMDFYIKRVKPDDSKKPSKAGSAAPAKPAEKKA